jgi:cation diffusion facilitator family transporter
MIDKEMKASQPGSSRQEAIDYRFLLEALFCLAGVVAGVLSGSLSLITLAVFSGIDTVNFIIRLFTHNQPPEPPRSKAYFGFSKYPGVLGVIEGIFFILAAIFIFREAGRRLEANLPAGNFYPAMAVLAVFLIAAYFIPAKQTKTAGKTSARYFKIEVILSLAILAVTLIVQFTRIQSLDPVISIFIVLFILGKSVQLMLESIKEILDNRLPQYEEEWIKGLIREHSGNHFRMHDLLARKSGSNRFIDFHLAINDNTQVEQAFDLANILEKELIKKIPGAIVIIHVET